VRRATVSLAPLPNDTVYTSAETIARNRRSYDRELMRKAKAAMGITGMRGRRTSYGDYIEFRPYGCATVMFISFSE